MRRRSALPALGTAAAVALGASSAEAAEIPLPPVGEGDAAVQIGGEYRLQGTFLTDFPVDAEGTTFGQGRVLDQRLRLGVGLRAGPMRLATEWDLFSGQLAGQTWDVPVTLDERRRHALSVLDGESFVARRAALTLDWPALAVEAGLVTSHWGLGMVANDGARDPLFGRNDFGDRVFRLRLTGRPLRARRDHPDPDRLLISLAGDWVVADDLARYDRGQLAFQGILAVVARPRGEGTVGLYAVYRDQVEQAEERQTRLGVVDLYADREIPLAGGRLSLRLAAEGALVAGFTDRSLTYNARDGQRVLAGGATALARLRPEGERWAVLLRGGYASGDPDPDDDLSSDFTFDRDHDVGAVLFDTVSAGIEAATYALITDPEHAGRPPDGAEALLTEGAFRRAAFVQPAGEVRPLPWLRLRAGIMLAFATAPVAQPFYTARAGGEPRNHHDLPPEGSHLGTEFDWSVTAGGAPRPRVPRLKLIAQGGHLLLGPALRGEGPAWVHQMILTGRISF